MSCSRCTILECDISSLERDVASLRKQNQELLDEIRSLERDNRELQAEVQMLQDRVRETDW